MIGQDLPALRADFVAFDARALAAAKLSAFAGNIRTRAGQLYNECLESRAAGFHLDTNIREQLERVRRDSDVAQPDGMEFNWIRPNVTGLLPIETIDGRLMPQHALLIAGIFRQCSNLRLDLGCFLLGDDPFGQFDVLHLMDKRNIAVTFLIRAGVSLFPGGHDTPSDVFKSIEPAQFTHAFLCGAHPLSGTGTSFADRPFFHSWI